MQSQLLQIAEALVHMHAHGVIHGDIKGANVLVSGNPTGVHILLCDFGLTKLPTMDSSAPSKGAGTLRWKAPELKLDAEDESNHRTEASDVWSFGMLIAEVG